MPFKKPNETVTLPFEDGQYHIKCMAIEDAPRGQYGERMRWVFTLVDASTNERVDTDDGEAFEWWYNTSTSLGVNREGTPSRGRALFQALLGRELEDDDDPDDLVEQAVGKVASAMIVINEKGYADIAKITPYKKAAKRAAPPPPEDEEPADPF